MNIKDKLSRLDKTRYTPEVSQSTYSDTPDESWIGEFQQEFGAKVLREQNSVIILKENFYPLQRHPLFSSVQAVDYILPGFHQIYGTMHHPELNLRKTLFVDLETTGISGGTGTYAFLVGLGHLELDSIVVRQFLLPDFQYEWLLLKYIDNAFLSFENVVSFNGKTFDIPLLRNRFVLNRMETVLDDLHHIDVLHAARRLWKRRLTSCDLENLEYVILGEERLHDVASELIPQIYFEFIRKRKAILLRDVLEHNYYDIANMILLTMKIGLDVTDPLQFIDHEEDLFSLARYYYQTGLYSNAVPLLENLRLRCSDTLLKSETAFLLSMSHKRMGNIQTSGELFQELLQIHRDHPEALEELAKYYEHREKNYHAALELIDRGIEHAIFFEQLGNPSPLSRIKESLLYRRNRLEKKIKQQAGKKSESEPE